MADDPPAALVDRMAQTFLKTDGDMRAVMQTMLDSKEFWSEGAYRSKMKSPLEMVASAVRAVNGDVDFAIRAGQPGGATGRAAVSQAGADRLFQFQPGVDESAGLMARMNFALQLAEQQGAGREGGDSRRPATDDRAGVAGVSEAYRGRGTQ